MSLSPRCTSTRPYITGTFVDRNKAKDSQQRKGKDRKDEKNKGFVSLWRLV